MLRLIRWLFLTLCGGMARNTLCDLCLSSESTEYQKMSLLWLMRQWTKNNNVDFANVSCCVLQRIWKITLKQSVDLKCKKHVS